MSMTRTLTTTLPADTLYVSGTVNGTATTWTNTEGQTWESVADRSEFDVYVVELTVINSVGMSAEYNFTLYYGLHLVFDRTAADVVRAKELKEKGLLGMSERELAEYLGGVKGAYNASDLNRVESAVDFIQSYLNGLQAALDEYRKERRIASGPLWTVMWDTFDLTIKKDWMEDDIPTDSDLYRYLSNVDLLTDAVAIVKSLPDSMEKLDYRGANEIERALMAEYDAATAYETHAKLLIDNTAAAIIFSGEIYGGEC